jgi:hypothetical protein
MNSDDFDALFRDVPRLTAEEITAFWAAWTVVGAPETHEAPPANTADELIAMIAAEFTVDSPDPERGNLRRALSARIAQNRESAMQRAIVEPTKTEPLKKRKLARV